MENDRIYLFAKGTYKSHINTCIQTLTEHAENTQFIRMSRIIGYRRRITEFVFKACAVHCARDLLLQRRTVYYTEHCTVILNSARYKEEFI